MPNTGRPSGGCHACKVRKVKCDQERPSCRRCLRNRRDCHGYPSAADLAFRNTLSTDVQERRRILPNNLDQNTTASPSRNVTTISRPMRTDWQAQAISFFFDDYVIRASESTVGYGFLQCTPAIWSQSNGAVAFEEAISAVALASFAHRSSLDFLRVQARQRYGKALQLSHATLRRSSEVSKDSTLAAILCLNIYEFVSGDMPPWSLHWPGHIDILEYLLHVRRLAPPETSTDFSWQLSTNAHIQLQIRNLTKRIRPSKETLLIVNDPRKEEHVRRAGNLVCEVCNLLASADEILRIMPTALTPGLETIQNQLAVLIHEAFELDRQLENWAGEASGPFVYASLEAPDYSMPELRMPIGLQESPLIHIYSSGAMAFFWNMHRCARNQLLQCLRDCIQRQDQMTQLHQDQDQLRPTGSISTHERSRPADKLPGLVADILASVPYLLGDIDQQGQLQHPRYRKAGGGYILIWPLTLMYFNGPTNEAQKLWIKKQLARIRADMGIQRATYGLGNAS